ncbi:MAG: hypothetical protein EOO06_12090 [Chitinophagaceae bacterium]|nr:MAG: hypothetical protein EOO06_12090 [Chitinophagaceae bacterium]
MRSKVFSALLFLFIVTRAVAQGGSSSVPSAGDLPNIIPPTPEASALLKADFLRVTPNTGAANFSIPLFILQSGNFSLPITLNYNSTGVKVEEIASMVGMGWTLNYGGVVSRTVMDVPDEVRDSTNNNLTPHNFSTPDYALLDYFDKENADKQSDIFSFAFGNYSGRFVLDQNLNPKPLSTYNLKISIINGSFMEGFKIIADDGTEYYFQDAETSMNRNLVGTNCKTWVNEYFDEVKTSWYLTKIVLPSRQSEINFTYVSGVTRFNTGFNESLTLNIATEQYQCSPGLGPSGSVCDVWVLKFSSCSREQYVQSKFISKIETSSGDKVEFFYDPVEREDLIGGMRIVSFKITNYLGIPIKNGVFNSSYQIAVDGSSNDIESKRLFLESIQIKDALNSTSNSQVYSFSYLNYSSLPKRRSYAQDIYGFYNGKINNTCLIPKLSLDDLNYTRFNNGNGYAAVVFGDRSVDTIVSANGMLKRIVYPTGGYDSIIYTPNYLEALDGSEILCGGVSIKNIMSYNAINQIAIKKEFAYRYYANYKRSTFRLTNPKFSEVRTIKSDGYLCMMIGGGAPSQIHCIGPSCTKATSYSSSLYPITTYGSQHVYHRAVLERTYGVNDDNGLVERKFLFYMDGGLVPQTKMGTEIMSIPYNIVPDIVIGENETHLYKRVNSTYKLIKSTIKNFENLDQSFGYNYFVRRNYSSICSNRPGAVMIGELEAFDVMEGRIYFCTPVLKTITEKEYDDNNKILETVTNMEYNIPLYAYPKVIKVNDSKGLEIRTEKKYPLDYTTLGFMTTRNIINPVIEEKVFKNNVLQTTKSQTYADWFSNGNVIAPQNVTMKIGSNLQLQKIDYHSYDEAGNLTSVGKENATRTTYLWDYKKNYPIAQVVNATSAVIAYTSFEADGTGNWSGVVPSSIQGTGGFTGRKYYSHAGFSLSKNGLSASSTYTVTYWSKNGGYNVNGAASVAGRTYNGWTLFEHQINNPAGGTITVSGSGAIDELRLHPKNAMMTTYTYAPLVGVTSQTDVTNRTTYYEYDSFGRLFLVRDHDRNILKKICYNYAGQVEECTVSTSALWQNTATGVRCKLNSNNQNTGEQEQEQIDNNPYSATYGQTRWIVVGTNTIVCPLPVACTTSTCSGVDKKCINNVCRTGYKVYTSSEYDSLLRKYVCIYHYEWSDGSWSQNYTEISNVPCGIAVE